MSQDGERLRQISKRDLVAQYRNSQFDVRREIAKPGEKVKVPEHLFCSKREGDAKILFGRALEHLPGTQVVPMELALLAEPRDRYVQREAVERMVGEEAPNNLPLTMEFHNVATHGEVAWKIYSGSRNSDAKVLSYLGSMKGSHQDKNLVRRYQQSYRDVYRWVSAESAEKTHNLMGLKKDERMLVIAEDCIASGDTMLGFLLLAERMGVDFKGLLLEVLTATPQALFLITDELLKQGKKAEIRIGFLGWGLSLGNPDGQDKNYIVRTDAVKDLPGEFVVGDIGDRSGPAPSLDFTRFRPSEMDYPVPLQSSSIVGLGFPRGHEVPFAILTQMRATQHLEPLPLVAIDAKRITGIDEFGVLFGNLEPLDFLIAR